MAEAAATTKLAEIILKRIRSRGDITFASFMESALYEPDLGYYTSPGRKVGAEGDFYTSMNVHSAFGRLISREIGRFWELLGSPDSFTVAEAGAGGGQLAQDILDAIAEENPACYAHLTYRLIEKEPSLQQAQAARLERHAGHLAWSSPQELAGGALKFTGCVISNELFDAMPVHLVEMTDDGLREVFVSADANGFRERLLAPSTPELEAYLRKFDVRLMPGQRAEINLAAPAWIASAAATLERGFVLTIDYGYLSEELYTPQRRNGTLLCYHKHSTNEDPYQLVGEQDITTHINFSSLIEAGNDGGLAAVWYGEQYRFLMGVGLIEELMKLVAQAKDEQESLKHRLAIKKLMLPEGGMGDTFKVLIQAKGVENPQLLCMRKWGMGL
ncbi:SAM-dependent methyltransferase [Geomonas nitrogeniifigens]|uniref:SAM-dependent methyltransferase n=1 Tax=Geomonas diazotrophica TaxID=2843197 RepID=A0ABX8JKC6_9BACT|nr:SAM-dependent methyltransferase [Geomonas nitrogeniifigens]QWV98843.1 SAM-dependent methyltransferase [Geomonas nitrogeniifigens]QXE87990.1 SAM-dependent methyltransferase [Geomonas nitrogeniifigens]